MPIGVRCPECGRKYALQDSLAGSKLQCVDCRTAIVVPGVPRAPTACAVCRADIVIAQRFKDDAGYYYCPGCWGEMERVLATLPPDARALRVEILRQRLEEVHRPVTAPRPRQSELVKLVHSVFNSRRTRNQLRVIIGVFLAGTVLSFIYPAAALTAWATCLLLGASVVIFSILWTFGPPFMDGWRTGAQCLKSTCQRNLWQEQNRDYRLRWPIRTPLLGLLLIALSWGYYALAHRHAEPLADPAALQEQSADVPAGAAPATQP